MAVRPPELGRRIATIRARERLQDELRSIAIDLLGPNEADEFPADCAGWVAKTTDAAVVLASESAVDRLITELETALGDVPPAVSRRLRDARIRRDVGFA